MKKLALALLAALPLAETLPKVKAHLERIKQLAVARDASDAPAGALR